MNCKNCGTPLMGMEHACPVCGAPLPTNTPQTQQPAMPGGVPMPEQLASQPPQMMPGGAPPAGLPTEEPAPAPEPKKGNNMFAILLLLVAFAAIGVGVFLALTDDEEKAPKEDNTQVEEETTTDDTSTTSNAMNYAGYSFTIPDGYSAALEGEHGLVIRGTEAIYSILVDYTKGYDYYKQEFQKQTTAPTEVVTASDKEYVLCTLTDGEQHASEYMTQASETSTFAGLIVRSDYTAATANDLNVINQVLTSALKQTDVTPGSEEDAGKEQIVNYIPRFKAADFAF